MILDSAQHAWMRDGKTLRLFEALPEARFVGGVVRNALLGAPVGDIDIAIPLEPEKVAARLKAVHIPVVPTGIEHGTLTAVIDGTPYEVTSLRRDVQTDGRRAVVSFTKDWQEDSLRRDFTMNALYVNQKGEVFDYHNGLADIENRKVRFVGDARTRIREDFLRILRLFRFHAWYGKGDLDAEALEAAVELKSGMAQLSAERIQKEFLKLLEAVNPLPVLRVMADTGILAEIIPASRDFSILERLVRNGVADPVLRLAALVPDGSAASIAARLKLSNAQSARLENVLGPDVIPSDPIQARKILYRIGSSFFADRVQFSEARDGIGRDALLDITVPRKFPLTGRDAMEAGVAEGPAIGRVLNQLENEWVENNFTATRDQLLVRLKKAAAAQPN